MIPVSILKTDSSKADGSVVGINPTVKLRLTAVVAILVLFSAGLSAQSASDWFNKGVEAFRWQRTDEAAVYFTRASEADPARDEYLLYLGLCYHSLGQYTISEDAYTRAIALNGPMVERLLLLRGNLRISSGDSEGASRDYDRVIDTAAALAASATLNRANMGLNEGLYENAVNDYIQYLVLEPNSPQKETIEALIGLLGTQVAADEERSRLLAEQARLDEELRRAEEVRLAEEQAQREALMNDLLESLSDSGKDTKNIGAGTEDIREDFEVSELED